MGDLEEPLRTHGTLVDAVWNLRVAPHVDLIQLDLCEALVAVFTLVTPTLIHRNGLMSLLVFNQILL